MKSFRGHGRSSRFEALIESVESCGDELRPALEVRVTE
jgi:hypothetical protein